MSIASDIQALASSLSSILSAVNAKLTARGTSAADTLSEIPSKIEAIPEEPSGSVIITTNNTHNVKQYAEAVVMVPTGITPTLSRTITENNTYDVTEYASVEVAVPTYPEPSGTTTLSSNGTHNVKDYEFALVDVETGYLIEQSYVEVSPGAQALVYTDSEVFFDNVKGVIISKADTDTNEDIAFLAICPVGSSYTCHAVRTTSLGTDVAVFGTTAVSFSASGHTITVRVESWVGSFSTTSQYYMYLIKRI